MATIRKRNTVVELPEAERVSRLLQEEFQKDLPEIQKGLPKSMRELNDRAALVGKWDSIVEALKAEDDIDRALAGTPAASGDASAAKPGGDAKPAKEKPKP